MMSLQVVAFCYMLFMLAVPTTICLLMTLKGRKIVEVKPQFKLQSPFRPDGLCNHKTLREEEYKNFPSFQVVGVVERIKHIEENPVSVDWEEWEEDIEVDDNRLEKEAEKASGVSTTPTDDSLLYLLQEEMEATSHVLLRKPMKKKKKGFGKSKRTQNRIIKPEWVRT